RACSVPIESRRFSGGEGMRESIGIDSVLGGWAMPKAYSEDMRARVIAEVESGGLGARSRRHCQRSRAFGCSAYRQSGSAEVDRRWPKMQPTFFRRGWGRGRARAGSSALMTATKPQGVRDAPVSPVTLLYI